jgi:type I restriction enzyme, S subunit
LVEQDPNDEPASELRNKRAAADVSFNIPESWAWARVGDVADCRLGKMLDKAKNKGTPRRYLRNVNVRWFEFDLSDLFEMRFQDSELAEFALEPGDVLVCEGGEPGRAAVWDGRASDIYFQKAIHRVRFDATVDPYFLVNTLRASAEGGLLEKYFTGVGIKHLTGKGLAAFLFPVPPVAEQRRIVDRIRELMALCERLQVARTNCKTRRDLLVIASLRRLSVLSIVPASLESVASQLGRLPHLADPSHVRELRETILTLGVRGQLVRQDSHDEPAAELLARIEQQKLDLQKSCDINRG